MRRPKGIQASEGISLLSLIILNVGALVVLRLCLQVF